MKIEEFDSLEDFLDLEVVAIEWIAIKAFDIEVEDLEIDFFPYRRLENFI